MDPVRSVYGLYVGSVQNYISRFIIKINKATEI